MARVRSPNYPALSLPEAIQMTAKVFSKENRHKAAKEVIVKAMGYKSINGASLGALSALAKYGLLERHGDDCRVADRALAILHPQTPFERAEAVAQAAREPALFGEMLADFPDSFPSDDNLRSYLVRRGFGEGALSQVIRSFRETMEFMLTEGPDKRLGAIAPAAEAVQPIQGNAILGSGPASPPPSPATGAGAFQINVMNDRLILNGTLFHRDMVEDLIRKLEANKLFLPEKPSDADSSEE